VPSGRVGFLAFDNSTIQGSETLGSELQQLKLVRISSGPGHFTLWISGWKKKHNLAASMGLFSLTREFVLLGVLLFVLSRHILLLLEA
jgi:hypothetical protein